MASVNQTRLHCVNEMGKTRSKPLAARHGRGKEWTGQGNGMLCVNRPLKDNINLPICRCSFMLMSKFQMVPPL